MARPRRFRRRGPARAGRARRRTPRRYWSRPRRHCAHAVALRGRARSRPRSRAQRDPRAPRWRHMRLHRGCGPRSASQVANDYAPEHLLLADRANRARWLERMSQPRARYFSASWSPEPMGDYCSGTNHVLPTYGYAARLQRPLADDFQQAHHGAGAHAAGLRAWAPGPRPLPASRGSMPMPPPSSGRLARSLGGDAVERGVLAPSIARPDILHSSPTSTRLGAGPRAPARQRTAVAHRPGDASDRRPEPLSGAAAAGAGRALAALYGVPAGDVLVDARQRRGDRPAVAHLSAAPAPTRS